MKFEKNVNVMLISLSNLVRIILEFKKILSNNGKAGRKYYKKIKKWKNEKINEKINEK